MQSSLFNQEVEQIERMRPLRPSQSNAERAVREAVREGHKRIVLQAPCGWGKTLWAAHIIAAALRKGSRPLFTCPAISLVEQTLKAFEKEGIKDIGVMQAHHVRTNAMASVQIASVQTLIKRAVPDIGFALLDEVHESFEALDALIDSEAWKDKLVIGLSATPWTKGMGLRWTKLVIAATINDLIADGHATPSVIYAPEKDIDRNALTVTRGEFDEGSASATMSEASIVGDVLTEWKEKSPREKTFAFCVNRAHAQKQMEAFQDSGIPFGYIDANTPIPERTRIFAKMQYGEIAGIASVGCLIRGIDEDVRCILDLQPTRSEIRHVQKWGRGIRTAEKKLVLIGLDHAGNNQSLGLFTDIYHDQLDMRKPGERGEAYKDDHKPAKPRKCAKCHNLVPPGARQCPVCHEKIALHTGVKTVDGRLVEISSIPKMSREQNDWLRELAWIARKSGFKNGWVRHAFEEKWGTKPTEIPKRGKEPTDEVRAFVREKRKAYLAQKKAASI